MRPFLLCSKGLVQFKVIRLLRAYGINIIYHEKRLRIPHMGTYLKDL